MCRAQKSEGALLGELKAGLLRRLQDLELAEPPRRDCGAFARLLEEIERLGTPLFKNKPLAPIASCGPSRSATLTELEGPSSAEQPYTSESSAPMLN